jgi:hypothetical protein
MATLAKLQKSVLGVARFVYLHLKNPKFVTVCKALEGKI